MALTCLLQGGERGLSHTQLPSNQSNDPVLCDTECHDCICLLKTKGGLGTSLVVQWLRIHLAMQGVQIQSLARELRSNMLQSS